MTCHNTPRRWKGFEITGRFTFWKYLSGSSMFGEIAEPEERSFLRDLEENDEKRVSPVNLEKGTGSDATYFWPV